MASMSRGSCLPPGSASSVKATAIDAVQLGFRTVLVEDACRGVGMGPDHIPAALAAMRAAGIHITTSAALGA